MATSKTGQPGRGDTFAVPQVRDGISIRKLGKRATHERALTLTWPDVVKGVSTRK